MGPLHLCQHNLPKSGLSLKFFFFTSEIRRPICFLRYIYYKVLTLHAGTFTRVHEDRHICARTGSRISETQSTTPDGAVLAVQCPTILG